MESCVCCPCILRYGTIHWSIFELLILISLRKTDSPFPCSYQLTMVPQLGIQLHIHLVILGWKFCVSCGFKISCLLSQTTVSSYVQIFYCVQETVFLYSSIGLLSFSMMTMPEFFILCRKISCDSLHYNHICCKKKASLMKAEGCINPWIWQ